jgi:hypothetical protein
MTSLSARHLTAESFNQYLRAAIPIEHPIPGTPRLLLFIDPDRLRIGLRGPVYGEVPSATGLEHVTVHVVHHEGRRQTEIAVTDSRLFIDGYRLLCAVADRVQLQGQSMLVALTETIKLLGHLLRREETLTREVEIGLLGELSVLGGVASVHAPRTALAAWRGGKVEEHDFGLERHDVEVKTTSSERREHWITSMFQLVPTTDRPLWLVSVQVTRAGSGGRTLGDLVNQVRTLYPEVRERDAFDARLQNAGWHDRYAETCVERWRMRTSPALFAVDSGFPRLTAELLAAGGVDTAHITNVRYQIDLTDLAETAQPAALAGVLPAAEGQLR